MDSTDLAYASCKQSLHLQPYKETNKMILTLMLRHLVVLLVPLHGGSSSAAPGASPPGNTIEFEVNKLYNTTI